jgi:Flp pilus assembly protein TadD
MPQEPQLEVNQVPPPHLAGALQAAAAARAMAERIRSRDMHLEPGRPRPPAHQLQTTARGLRTHAPRRGRPPHPSFARTIEAAKLLGPATSSDGELVPWHLSLRQEADRRSWPQRWMARIFGRAAERESGLALPQPPADRSPPVTPAMETANQASTFEPAPCSVASDAVAAGFEPPRARNGASGDLQGEPIARLPSLRARELRWDELSRELPSKTEHEAKTLRNASQSALSWRWRWADAAGCQVLTLGSVARALVPGVTSRVALTRETFIAANFAPGSKANLPVPVPSRSVVRWSSGAVPRPEARPDAFTSGRSAAPAERVESGRLRAARRFLLVSVAIFAGLTLGMVTSGSAVLTGFSLSQTVVELHELLLRSINETTPSHTSHDTQIARRLANADTGAQDDNAAVVDGSKDASQAQSASGSATSTKPETAEPASEPSWAALYARGHRAQSEGDLVAATHWYQQAAALNPDHPAILYDLGYMLQVQGDIDGAIDKYRKVIELDPNHAYAQYDLGFLLQKKGNKKDAVTQYRKAAKLNPENPYIYFDWARILESDNDLAGAKALYEKAVELAPQRRPGTDARRRLAALNARKIGP